MPACGGHVGESIGPEGLVATSVAGGGGGVEAGADAAGAKVGAGAGEAATGCREGASCGLDDCCLQPANARSTTSAAHQVTRRLGIGNSSFLPGDLWSSAGSAGYRDLRLARRESSHISISMAVGPTMNSA